MRLKRENDTLLLTFSALESRLLQKVLRQLAEDYRPKPEELDPKAALAWYSTRGCASPKMSEEETKDWLGQLHAFKSARLDKLEDWLRQLTASGSGEFRVRLALDDAPAFMASINDYRLLAATRHDIGQREMDLHWPWQLAKLPAARQEALLEIHFLAWLLEATLQAIDEA